jgi:hypothetical protein
MSRKGKMQPPLDKESSRRGKSAATSESVNNFTIVSRECPTATLTMDRFFDWKKMVRAQTFDDRAAIWYTISSRL